MWDPAQKGVRISLDKSNNIVLCILGHVPFPMYYFGRITGIVMPPACDAPGVKD